MSSYRDQKTYEELWRSDGLQDFTDYERNRLLKRVSGSLMPTNGASLALDVAAGDGVTSAFLRGLGWDVVAFDISPTAAKRARNRAISDFLIADVEAGFPFKDGSFDLVFWGDNVEHLKYPLDALLEISRVLHPSGLLVLSTPNTGWLPYRLYHLATGMICRSEGHLNPPWAWEHIRFFNSGALKSFLASGGFVIADFWGCDRRRIFDRLSRVSPSLLGSILVVLARKSGDISRPNQVK